MPGKLVKYSPVERRSCVDDVADVSPVSSPLLSQMAIRISVQATECCPSYPFTIL